MADHESITQEYLKSILDYDPETGEWLWLPRPVHMFKEGGGIYTAERNAVIWNKRFAGKPAGHHNADGYLMIRINGRYLYFTHILAFIYMEGRVPPHQTDHRDRDPRNCRWENIRYATPSQNGCNKRLQRNNTSGHRGIDWHKLAQSWRVRIKINGREIHVGLFKRLEDAIAARQEAAERHHGDFANHD